MQCFHRINISEGIDVISQVHLKNALFATMVFLDKDLRFSHGVYYNYHIFIMKY